VTALFKTDVEGQVKGMPPRTKPHHVTATIGIDRPLDGRAGKIQMHRK